MSQLDIEGNIPEADLILNLAEEYERDHGHIDNTREFTRFCKRKGAFASRSETDLILDACCDLVRNAFRRKERGLTRMIYTGSYWRPRHLATKDECFAHFAHLEASSRRDLEALRKEHEYLMDRFEDAPVSPLLDLEFVDEDLCPA